MYEWGPYIALFSGLWVVAVEGTTLRVEPAG